MMIAQIFVLLLSIAFIVLWGFVFMYVRELENIDCKCADDWRKYFIQYFSLVIILVIVLAMFGVNMFNVWGMMYMLLYVAFVIIVFTYIHDLKKKKCECSEAITRTVLEIVNYIQLSLIIILLILSLFFGSVLVAGIKNAMIKPLKFTSKYTSKIRG